MAYCGFSPIPKLRSVSWLVSSHVPCFFEAATLRVKMATSVMVDADTIRDFSDAQLSDWLEERDIPLEFCHVFESKLCTALLNCCLYVNIRS